MSTAEMARQQEYVETLKQQQQQQQGTAPDAEGERGVTTSSSTVPSSAIFDDDTLTPEEQRQRWQLQMEDKYGEGSYQLFRSLYKDLCDEMRREYFTKPPPPFPVEQVLGAPPPTTFTGEGASSSAEGKGATRAAAAAAAAQSPVRWSVVYQPGNNNVVFRRDAVPSTRLGRVVAYSPVVVGDPPKLNALLTFADWCPIEVLVERRGVIVHFSVACNEGGMHLRNVRAYESPSAAPTPAAAAAAVEEGGESDGVRLDDGGEGVAESSPDSRADHSPRPHQGTSSASSASATPDNILDATDDAEWCRHNLCYDGPCLWHLELDFLNELYDVLQDHGITLDWMRWASEWVHFLEHAQYSRWAVGLLEELVPARQRGPEGDFLLPEEQESLDAPVEDWLSARAL